MRQHQSNGLRMFTVEQLAQLLRIGTLQLRQISVRLLLRAPHQHQQVVCPLLAEGVFEHAAGVVQPAMHHEVLRVEKTPKLLQHLGRKFRGHAPQIGQLLRQSAARRPRAARARTPWPDPRPQPPEESPPCARPESSPNGLSASPRFHSPVRPKRVPSRAPGSTRGACQPSDLLGMNPALQQPRTLRRFALQVRAHLLEDLLRPLPLRISSACWRAQSSRRRLRGSSLAPGASFGRQASAAPAWRAAARRSPPAVAPAAAPHTSPAPASSQRRSAPAREPPAEVPAGCRQTPGPAPSACRRARCQNPPPPAPVRSGCATLPPIAVATPRRGSCSRAASSGRSPRSPQSAAERRPGFSTTCFTVFETP